MSNYVSPRSYSHNPKPAEVLNKNSSLRRLTPNHYSSSNINGIKILRDSQVSQVNTLHLKQQLANFKKGLEGVGRNFDTSFIGGLRSYPKPVRVHTEKGYTSQKPSIIQKNNCPSPNLMLQKSSKGPIRVKRASYDSRIKIEPTQTSMFKTEEAERQDEGRWKFNISKDQMKEAVNNLHSPVKLPEFKFNKDTNDSADSESSSERSSEIEFDFNKDIRNIFKINVPKEEDEVSCSVDETAISNADEKINVKLGDTKEKQFIQSLKR